MWIHGIRGRAYESPSQELREISYRRRRIAERGPDSRDRVHAGHAGFPGARAGQASTGEDHQNPRLLPLNYDRNGPQAFPQSNMVVLVDTDAGITGIGQGGSPDTVRNVARSVIGKNAFDTEMIWQAAFMDGFYSPGKERLHALGAIDLALWF